MGATRAEIAERKEEGVIIINYSFYFRKKLCKNKYIVKSSK